MHRRLQWKAIGIEEKLERLWECLKRLQCEIPSTNTNEIEKFTRWIEKIEEILTRIHTIKSELQPQLEENLRYKLGNSEMLILALFQPSTKNLFTEIEIHFRKKTGLSLTSDELNELAALSEVAKTLAWIGDAALNLAVLFEIWEPQIAKVSILTDERKKFVENSNLARLCDKWNLYEHRIHFDPPIDPTIVTRISIDHVKGTIIEAIYGIIFLLGGLSQVGGTLKLLRSDPAI